MLRNSLRPPALDDWSSARATVGGADLPVALCAVYRNSDGGDWTSAAFVRCFAALGHARLDGDDVCDSRDRDFKLRRADAIRSIHWHVRNRNPDGGDLLDACVGISRTTTFDTAHGVLARHGSAGPASALSGSVVRRGDGIAFVGPFLSKDAGLGHPRGNVTARTVDEDEVERRSL